MRCLTKVLKTRCMIFTDIYLMELNVLWFQLLSHRKFWRWLISSWTIPSEFWSREMNLLLMELSSSLLPLIKKSINLKRSVICTTLWQLLKLLYSATRKAKLSGLLRKWEKQTLQFLICTEACLRKKGMLLWQSSGLARVESWLPQTFGVEV